MYYILYLFVEGKFSIIKHVLSVVVYYFIGLQLVQYTNLVMNTMAENHQWPPPTSILVVLDDKPDKR